SIVIEIISAGGTGCVERHVWNQPMVDGRGHVAPMLPRWKNIERRSIGAPTAAATAPGYFRGPHSGTVDRGDGATDHQDLRVIIGIRKRLQGRAGVAAGGHIGDALSAH